MASDTSVMHRCITDVSLAIHCDVSHRQLTELYVYTDVADIWPAPDFRRYSKRDILNDSCHYTIFLSEIAARRVGDIKKQTIRRYFLAERFQCYSKSFKQIYSLFSR